MTLTVAFVRQLPDRESRKELIFASDSRLSCGQRLDFGKKLFDLPRSDALLGFAGDCDYAYPWMMHLRTSIQTYPRSSDRRFPLRKARGHFLRVFDQMYGAIYGFPVGQTEPHEDEPRVQFLFGGYFWQDRDFRYWYVDLDRERKAFRWQRGRQFHFIGDPDAVAYATKHTHQLLASRGKTASQIDLEPIEVLVDVIRDTQFHGVGGAPQVAKVYEYMQVQFFSTLWRDDDGNDAEYVFGRQLLAYEQCDWPTFDSNALRFGSNRGTNA